MSNYQDILRHYWGYDDFRELQEDIIQSVCDGRDTLALMPTGGGKSLTFQIPSMAMNGICLVVTPLVALMKDQVENLKARDIRAAAIYSGMTRQEIILTLDNCHYGDFKFLYVSPERLSTELFRERIVNMEVNLIAVDEAHCISQWGYDFRPSYLNIAEIRELLPGVPVLALTATATPAVVEDIQKRLHFKEPNVFKKSFERTNLAYVVRQTEDKEKELLHILDRTPGSAIVYVSSRKATKELAVFLRKNGLSADYFHAGLTNESKDDKQKAWKSDACRIIVATNAFGMGIDKADVRVVVHMDLPESIEAYFQEAGRAGRDGKKSYAVLLFHKSDTTRLKKHLSDSFPSKDSIRNVYESLAFYYQLAAGTGAGAMFAFNLTDFCTKFKFNYLHAFNSLKILEQAGYLELTDEMDHPSRVYFLVRRDDLYQQKLGDKLSEDVLQVLLRSYTGLFADFMPIQEELLAKRLGTTADQVYQRLLGLSKIGIIHYIPRKKSPYIIFTVDREDTERVAITKEVYEDRQDRMEKRIRAILAYSTEQRICRSRQLLEYFGQKDVRNCGHCDVCLSKNELGIKQFEFEQIEQAVLDKLKEGPVLHDELIDAVSLKLSDRRDQKQDHQKKSVIDDNSKIIKVIRYLCDQNKIGYDTENHHFFA
ncbi:MAG: ATP-dependent DNA helicase RecQ [Bacteroidota bacterium]|nr:ATP-dependent DNA helicase RecQ [Bacteroidota bacterium]